MAYFPYATLSDYLGISDSRCIEQTKVASKLKQASRHIDSLTFGRINRYGFDNLTTFQKDIIREVTCRLADFEYENEDLIQSVLSSYSLNDVSMSIGNTWNVYTQNGVAISKDLYALLCQTGLCTGLAGV